MYRQTHNELRLLQVSLQDPDHHRRLHKLQGCSDYVPGMMSMEEKLLTAGFMNLHTGRINEPTRRYAGQLPLQRLGSTPCVAVQASPSWVTGGVHMAKHMPSFKEFCAQRRNEEE